MSQRLTRILLLPLLLLAGQAMALGLGNIRLSSALNEPLRAEIELLAASPDELTNLTVQMASAETFERYGLDRPLWLSQIQFNVQRTGTTTGNVIQIASAQSITEPFVTFLVEAVWARGRLLREYTVLLDPPTFAPPRTTGTTQSVTPPSRSTQSDAGRIERTPTPPPAEPRPTQPPPVQPPVQSAVEEPPLVAPEEPPQVAPGEPESIERDEPPAYEPPYDPTSGDDMLVQRGDTLWGIAQRVKPDNRLTINQVMMAIFEANPEAFGGNINVLRAGTVLRVPSADDVFNISRSQANSDVQQQHDEWSGGTYTPPAPQQTQTSLQLVPPDEDVVDDYSDASASTDLGYSREVEIEDRISELEADVPDQAALLEIRNNELAQLRAELARLRGEEPLPLPVDDDEPTPADEEFTDEETPVDAEDSDQIFVDEDNTVVDEGPVADEDTDATVAPPVVSAQPAKPSLVDTILGYVLSIWGAIGAAVLIVLGILIWFARRAAREDDDESGTWDSLQGDDLDGMASSTARLSALAQEDDTAIVVVEQESKAAMAAEMKADPVFEAEVDPLASTDTNKVLEDTFSSETAINLDQSDPIAEADFHMAYGLHDQAADLIIGALEVEPEREDMLAKLCEVYFVWGNRDGFVDAAHRMKGVVGDASNAEWDKIVIMGQQIAADHELFSGKSAGAATKAVDLSFEGGMDEAGELDIDFASAGDDGAFDVIDLGAASGEVPAATDASSIDFAFEDEPDLDASVTREMPQGDQTASALDDVFGDATIDAGLEDDEMAATAAMPASDATASSPTIEEQFASFDATGEMSALSEDDLPADNEATELASLDDADDQATELASLDDVDDQATELASLDDEHPSTEATAEIDLDDLGLDLDSLADTALAGDDEFDIDDLDKTGESEALNLDDIDATGTNENVGFGEATGRNPMLDESDTTGINEALDIDDALVATSEMPSVGDTSISKSLDDLLDDQQTNDPDSATSLLDATGQTQVLPDDFAVETGTGINIGLTDADATMLAPEDDDEPTAALPEDAATMLAPLDDDDDDDFDFAKTEALPKDVFTGDISTTDETGELPAFGAGSTDMDLDLDDLTAALKVSEVGDTINQPRDDATVEQPRIRPEQDMDVDDDESRTQALGPDDLSDDLHDARTMTEVGTKLDLARAYVDMGDPSGARSILDEVLDEGDDSQRQQAQQLLDSLPS